MSDSRINKRAVGLFCFILILLAATIVQLLTIAVKPEYIQAASAQSRYRVEIGTSRGRIYDCKMRSLAGGRIEYHAVIEPSPETIEHLSGVLSPNEMDSISDRLTGRSPFVYVAENASIAGRGVTVYRCESRYGDNTFARHIVGYLNGSGEGVSGIEYAYQEYLKQCSGHISAVYTVDSRGRNLSGMEPVVTDTTDISKGGVVLTLDMDLQQIVENAAEKYIERGAVVLMELPSGKIRAAVSRPDFEQDNLAAYLEREDGALVNRSIAAYDVGSVFKLVVAAAALENGINPEWSCECEGSIQIGDNVFHCNKRTGHGEIAMCDAIAGSCNIYFIKLAQEIKGELILEYAKKFGFGERICLADNYMTSAGCLPEEHDMVNPAALANLSFGQGELMATPVHIAQMIGAVANNGVMPAASVIESLVSPSGYQFEYWENASGRQTINPKTAQTLRSFMAKTVTDGTGAKGESDWVAAGAKTGTAQTGIIKDGRSVLQAWYAGFFPLENPEYVCVVVVEDGESGGSSAGPVFKYISDELYG